MERTNRYSQLIEAVFFRHYTDGDLEVSFMREEIEEVAVELGVKLPKNLGDIMYSFRYRTRLPDSIRALAPEKKEWVILAAGRGKYKFIPQDTHLARILPNELLSETKIPEATPGLVLKYTGDDEQALLAKLRYNRLIDIFSGVSAFSLQNHLRTTVPEVGQVETDEIYVGVDKRGIHYVFPVQAKGHNDMLGVAQIEQDFLVCETKFPDLVCMPIAAQFMKNDVIALFGFERQGGKVSLSSEKHFRLVPPDGVNRDDLELYKSRTE